MNLLRVGFNYGDILTFTMRPWFVTVVIRSMLYRHRRFVMVVRSMLYRHGRLVMVREGIRGQQTHSQKHYAHTSHAHEEKKQTY